MASTANAFVGRQRELAELKEALEDALSGQGRLVMLVGEPGIGKTRTVEELAAYAQGHGSRVLWGRCYDEQGTPPYWPWVQAIRPYVREQESERLRSELGVGAAEIAEVVSEVKERLPDLKPATPVDSPEQARFRLFDSITSFLKAVSHNEPLVLVLDDLHWADQPSLLLLQFVTRELAGAPLLLLGTYRDVDVSRRHPLSQALGELTRERLFQRVLLRGWVQDEVGRFIQTVSGISPSSGLVEYIHRQTEGNPFFVTEVMRLLLQEGELTSGRSRQLESWTMRVPEGVREVIGRRLDRLSEQCNQTLTIAAVVGREFTLDQLKLLEADSSEDALLEVVEEALQARVIGELPGLAGQYQFTHALVQETLAEELSLTRRVRLHARIAGALEELYGPEAEAHAAELAFHYAQAEASTGGEKLVHYSQIAGERALASYAYEEALIHFQRALAVKEGQPLDEETAALLFGLGRAQRGTLEGHRLQEVTNTMEPAFNYYLEAGDVRRALAIAEYLPLASPTRTGLLAKALTLVPPDSLQAGRLLARYGANISASLGDYDGAIKTLNQALAIAQRQNDTALERAVLTSLADRHWFHLHPQECLDASLRAIELGRPIDQPQVEMDFLSPYWIAVRALIALGDIQSAWLHAATQLELAVQLRGRSAIAQALHANEVLAFLEGDWHAARQFSDRGLEVAQRDARLLSHRAILEYQVGNIGKGDAYLERLLETMGQAPPGWVLGHVLAPYIIGVGAYITGIARRSNVAEAAAATAFSSPSTVPYFAQLPRVGLALLAVVQGDVATACEQYDALKPWPITVSPLHLVCGHRVLGLLARTMGTLDQAMVHFEDSLTFCRKAGCRPELAWTCHDYAELLLQRGATGDHTRATSLLGESRAVSNELGMKPLMDRVVTLQEQAQSRPPRAPAYPDGLSRREVEVLRLIAAGKTDREIAEALVISVRTVGNHVGSILSKTRAINRTEAAAYAARQGLA